MIAGFYNATNKITNVLIKILEIISVIVLVVLTLTVITNVFFRYVLNAPIVGADELAMLLLIWVTFLGVCLSIRERSMIAVTALIDKLAGRGYLMFQILIEFSIVLFSILFLIIGLTWFMSPSVISASSPALQIPYWIPYSVFPFSMLLMLILSIMNILNLLMRKSEV